MSIVKGRRPSEIDHAIAQRVRAVEIAEGRRAAAKAQLLELLGPPPGTAVLSELAEEICGCDTPPAQAMILSILRELARDGIEIIHDICGMCISAASWPRARSMAMHLKPKRAEGD